MFCEEKGGNDLELIFRNAEDVHRGVYIWRRAGEVDCLLHPGHFQQQLQEKSS